MNTHLNSIFNNNLNIHNWCDN
uniref:Uncharacterized protein n=1 Tax=Rhizophora mucronata TaxID=61149 RepID=A0A2P2Q1X3_RHIMU